MKPLILTCAFCCLLAVPCSAQESSAIGLGIAFNPVSPFANATAFLPVGLLNIYVPLRLNAWLRIEPEIGLLSVSDETDEEPHDPARYYLRLGTGIVHTWKADPATLLYTGARGGVLLYTAWAGYDHLQGHAVVSQTSVYAGACVGAEYYLSPHFSLGAEAQINYIAVSPIRRTPEQPGAPGEVDRSMISNNGLLCARWYF